MSARPAAGGGRWVEVAPAWLRGRLTGFVARHGPATGKIEQRRAERGANNTTGGAAAEAVRFVAADGAEAECIVPFPPLP